MVNYHLVILKKPYLEAIFEGRKRIESRFTMSRREFIDQVGAGDRLFLKRSSGPVCGEATAEEVKRYERLTPEKVFELKRQYNGLILGDEDYWRERARCRFGVLVWLRDVRRIEPVKIDKKDWRAWVVLRKGMDFGLLSGVR